MICPKGKSDPISFQQQSVPVSWPVLISGETDFGTVGADFNSPALWRAFTLISLSRVASLKPSGKHFNQQPNNLK